MIDISQGAPETLACRKGRPCRFEHLSQPELQRDGGDRGSPHCPYRVECDSTAGNMQSIVQAYGQSIRVSLSEPSSSIVVRSEHQYSGDERRRLCLRKHLYESHQGRRFIPFRITPGVVLAIERDLQYQMGQEWLPLTSEGLEEIKTWLRGLLLKRKEDVQEREVYLELHEQVSAMSRLGESPEEGPDDARASARERVYGEIKKTIHRHARAILACYPSENPEPLTDYLGFVDIRLNSSISPVAMALLVPPRGLRRDPNVTIITGNYGPLFGAHGFESTVYSMHEPIAGGARCAQACVIMALATLADRGARILGSYELTWLGKNSYTVATERDETCLENRGREAVQAEFPYEKIFAVDGLLEDEIVQLLRHPECGTTVDAIYLPPSWTNYRRCKRLVEAYISARFPVIMFVDAAAWSSPSSEDPPSEAHAVVGKGWHKGQPSVGHAVVVVGFRRSFPAPSARKNGASPGEPAPPPVPYLAEVTEFIVHDPAFQPFVQRPVKHCLMASCQYAYGDVEAEQTHLFLVADASVKRHADHCLKTIEDQHGDLWHEYFEVLAPDPQYPADYRITLLHRDDVLKAFACPRYDRYGGFLRRDGGSMGVQEKRRFQELETLTGRLSGQRYWCVAAYKRQRLERLWLFDAAKSPDAGIDEEVPFRPEELNAG